MPTDLTTAEKAERLGLTPGYLYAISTVAAVKVAAGCENDTDELENNTAVVVVPADWWAKERCWCDHESLMPDMPPSFFCFLEGCYEYTGSAEDAVAALDARGWKQHPEIVDGATMVTPTPSEPAPDYRAALEALVEANDAVISATRDNLGSAFALYDLALTHARKVLHG